MTETPGSIPGPSQAASQLSEEWSDPSTLPLAEVRDLFVTMTKALRAFQLYDHNNPVYARFVTALRTSFETLWKDMDTLQVLVEEDHISWLGNEVYREESRTDSLAFLLYKDGIRDVTFLKGIETEELERFLDILRRARLTATEGDDLLAILWEEDLERLRYSYVDLGAEGIDLPERGTGGDVDPKKVVEEILSEEGGEPATEEEFRPTLASAEDFSPTLYFLDQREMERLQDELDLELQRDVRGDVMAGLFDRLEEAATPERRTEILGILRTLLPNMLSRGALGAAAQILQELNDLLAGEGALQDPHRAEATAILDEVSSSGAIEELVRSLEDGSVKPGALELGQFVGNLRASALAHLLRAAEVAAHRELRPVLVGASEKIASAQPEVMSEILGSDDPLVVTGALRLAGKLQMVEWADRIAALMRHPEDAVRLAAVEAAVRLRASTVIAPLQQALADSSRDVRIAAARGLGSLQFPRAARRFRQILTSRAMRRADLTEKIAFFDSYGRLGDEDAVGFLGKILNGRGFLGRKESADMRACAALALGRVGSPEGRSVLEVAQGDDDPVVRNAVSRALRAEGPD